MTEILEKIRNIRLSHGYTQEYMAEKLGIDTVNYGRIERGKSKLTLDRFLKICEILQVSPNELLNDENNEIIEFLKKIYKTEIEILETLKTIKNKLL